MKPDDETPSTVATCVECQAQQDILQPDVVGLPDGWSSVQIGGSRIYLTIPTDRPSFLPGAAVGAIRETDGLVIVQPDPDATAIRVQRFQPGVTYLLCPDCTAKPRDAEWMRRFMPAEYFDVEVEEGG